MSWTDILLWAAALLAACLIAYACWVEPYRIRLSKFELAIPNLPRSLEGFTICHLSDTHTAKYGRLERKLGQILGGLRADLCVITGDLLHALSGVEALRRALSSFEPKLGVFAVLGNGDYKLKLPAEKLASELERSGIRVLLNDHATLPLNGENLYIIGVNDPFCGLDELSRAMSGMAGDGFKLLLAHSPDVLVEMADHPVDLILAGHTHGGQVRLPFLGALWLHCRYRLGISSGYFSSQALSRMLKRDMSGVRLYVSRGLGASGISARFMCSPEIALITLIYTFEEGRKMVHPD